MKTRKQDVEAKIFALLCELREDEKNEVMSSVIRYIIDIRDIEIEKLATTVQEKLYESTDLKNTLSEILNPAKNYTETEEQCVPDENCS